jgi:hypothetical protein
MHTEIVSPVHTFCRASNGLHAAPASGAHRGTWPSFALLQVRPTASQRNSVCVMLEQWRTDARSQSSTEPPSQGGPPIGGTTQSALFPFSVGAHCRPLIEQL